MTFRLLPATRRSRLILIALLALIVAATAWWLLRKPAAPAVATSPVSRGDIEQTVDATGVAVEDQGRQHVDLDNARPPPGGTRWLQESGEPLRRLVEQRRIATRAASSEEQPHVGQVVVLEQEVTGVGARPVALLGPRPGTVEVALGDP